LTAVGGAIALFVGCVQYVTTSSLSVRQLAAVFGGGTASSSDGQFFRAGGFGREASNINIHYGDEPGVKFYTHLFDRYAPFHTKVIAATASEAAHVIDGPLYRQSEVAARRHTPMAAAIPTMSSPSAPCSGFGSRRGSRI
jgi:TnpA family transposase